MALLTVGALHTVQAQEATAYPRDNDEDYTDNYYHKSPVKKKAPATAPTAPAPKTETDAWYPPAKDSEGDGSQENYAKHPSDNDTDYKAPVQRKENPDNFYPTYYN
jgi:hypothetical protein